jgi:hypothetical protein
MADNKLKIELIVDDKGSVEVKKFGDQTQQTFEKSKSHTLAYAAAAAAALYGVVKAMSAMTGMMKEAVALANVQEAAEANLGAVLKATGGAAGYNLEQMKKMAAGMQSVTTVGDEVILNGMAMLATFKEIRGEGFERATKAALDMSQVLGTDMKSSVVMIGKALNDPIANLSAMTRAGVQFTDQQTEMIKTLWEAGDAAAAQNIILEELESQMGGAAEAARKTFGGAVQAAKNDLGDMKEEMGFVITKNQFLVELVNLAGQAFQRMGKYVQENRQYLMEMVKNGILFLVEGIVKTIEVMRFFHNAWLGIKLVGTAALQGIAWMLEKDFQLLRMFLTPLDLIFKGMQKLGAIDVNPFDSIEGALTQFKLSSADVTKDVIADIQETNRTYDMVADTVRGWKARIAEIPVAQVKATEATAETAAAIRQVGVEAKTTTDAIEAQTVALEERAKAAKKIVEEWKPRADLELNIVASTQISLFDKLKDWAESVKTTGKLFKIDVGKGGQGFAKEVLAASGNVALAWGQLIIEIAGILQSIVEMPAQIVDAVSSLFDSIGNFGSTLTTAIDRLIDSVYNMIVGIGDIFTRLIPKLITMAPEIILAMVRAVPVLIQAISDSIPLLIDTFISEIPRITAEIIKSIPDIAKALIDAIVDTPGNIVEQIPGGSFVGDVIGTVGDFVGDIFGGFGFHQGGIVGQTSPSFVRTLPAMAFASAPRLHAGFAPDEFPAILQRGERVLSRREYASVGGERGLRNDGGTVHVHLNLDGREIGSAIIQNGEVIEQIDYSLSKLWKRHYA